MVVLLSMTNPQYVPPSPEDIEFRRKAKELIDSAKSEVVILTGEFGLFGYGEIKESIRNARSRNVQFKIYHSRAPDQWAKELHDLNCEVFKGTVDLEPHHYLSVDRRTYMVSEQEGRKVMQDGPRYGFVYGSGSKTSGEIVDRYEELKLESEIWPKAMQDELDKMVNDEKRDVLRHATERATREGRAVSFSDVIASIRDFRRR